MSCDRDLTAVALSARRHRTHINEPALIADVKSIASIAEYLAIGSTWPVILSFDLCSARTIDAHHAGGYISHVDEIVTVGGVGGRYTCAETAW